MFVIYTYAKCSTCRKAVKCLKERGVKFEERPIRETPPSARELKTMLDAQGGNLRRIFNTSSQDYRDLKLSDRIDHLKPEEAFALMASNGNLVRRPFLLGDGIGLIGFDEEAWNSALKKSS